ncbi:uncharacterized protein LOC128211609 [Mya arenaria]|uniref:uncharacterized protein LOC128211609 n=1 Tax=Mya arenaria TaxID=6604 RepID=UPI0022DEB35F|nr:uncharacterized protein LOC128211609 [Mya arenaria]
MDGEEMAEDDKGVAIYIVQQEGTDVEGMTYTVVENEGAEGQPMSLDAIMGGGSVTMVTENGEEQALPPSQYHVLQQLEVIKTEYQPAVVEGSSNDHIVIEPQPVSEGDNYSVLPTAEDTSTGPDQSLSYYCQFCGSILVSLNELKSHMAERHNASIEVEEMDGIVYDEANQSEVDNKNRTEDEGMTIELCCSMCNLVFDDKDKLEAHMYDKHSMENLDSDSFLKCPFCPRMFAAKWQNSLYEHLKEKHDSHTGPIEVEVVKMKAAKKRSKDAYRPSPMYSEKEAEATCHLCNLTFKHKKNLPIHLTKYHQMSEKEIEEILGHDFHIPTMFSCPVCSKQFLWPATLKRHMLEHDPEGKSPNTRRNVFFRCLYCPLTTRYACSVRKHISRIHPEKVKDIDINKLSIPKFTGDVPDDVKENVITLDKRPAEEKYKDFAVVYICPFCDYVTQLPSNLSRHLTSKAHNKIFTSEELKAIKVSSFKVKKGSNTSELPKLQLDRKVRDIVNVKRKQMELPPLSCDETDLDIFDDDERENEEEQEDPSYDPRRDSKGMTAPLKVYGVSSNKSKEIVSPVSSLTGKGSVCVLGKDGTVKKLFPKSVAEISVKQEAETEEMITGTTTEDTLDDTETIPEQVEDIGEVGREKGEKQTQTDNMDAVKAAPDSERIKCLKCPLRFADIQSLLKHIVLHKNVVLDFSCQICKEKFPFYSELLEHDEKVHKGKMGTTNVMKAVAMSSINTSRKPMTTYDCPYCEMLFGQPGSLDKHARLDHKEHLKRSGDGAGKRDSVCGFNCYFCELSFFSILQLVEHMQAVHPNAERPGQVEFSDLSARKSSRKRKLPKWLEKDMEFGEEVKKKKSELPVRVGSIQVLNAKPGEQKEKVAEKADDAAETLASKKNVPVAHSSESVPTSKAKDDDKEVTVDVSDGRVVKHSTKKRIQSEKATQSSANVLTKHPIDRKSDENKSQTDAKQKTVLKQKQNKKMAMLHTKEKASTPKKLQDESLKEVKSSVKRKRQTQSVNLEDIIVDSPAAKCPHCSFVAKRSSALAFHINMNHPDKKVIKKEVDEESLPGDINDEPIDDNLATDKDYQYTGPKSKHKTEAIQTDELRNEKREDYQDGDSDLESDIDLMDLDISGDITDRGCVEVNDGEEVREFAVEVNEEENRCVLVYECPFCGLNCFQSTYSRLRHVQTTHTKEYKEFSEREKSDFKKKHKCPCCEKVFQNRRYAKAHLRSHPEFKTLEASHLNSVRNSKTVLKCSMCNVIHNSIDIITHHIEVRHPSNVSQIRNVYEIPTPSNPRDIILMYNCPRCSFRSVWRSGLYRHMRRKHKDEKDIFTETFYVDLELNKGDYCCPHCTEKFDSPETVVEHSREHHPEKCVLSANVIESTENAKLNADQFQCPYCDMTSQYTTSITRHVARHHPSRKKSFHNSKILRLTGDAGHVTRKVFGCEYCSYETDYRSCLNRHVERKHPIAYEEYKVRPVKPRETQHHSKVIVRKFPKKVIPASKFVCIYCQHKLESDESLKYHVASEHNGFPVVSVKVKYVGVGLDTPVYSCPQCQLMDLDLQAVASHIQQHDDNEESENSNKSVDGKQSGLQVYVCNTCSKAYESLYNLVLHSHKSHGKDAEVMFKMVKLGGDNEELVNKYNCPICSFISVTRDSLVSHLQSKHGIADVAVSDVGGMDTLASNQSVLHNNTGFKCPYCNVCMQKESNIFEHIVSKHPEKSADVNISKIKESHERTKLLITKRKRVHQCVHCNMRFRTSLPLRWHMRRFHPKVASSEMGQEVVKYIDTPINASHTDRREPNNCPVCGARYVWRKRLQLHMRKCHGSCFQVYKTLDNLADIVADAIADDGSQDTAVVHLKKRMKNGRPTRCRQCNVMLNNFTIARMHIKLRHRNVGRSFCFGGSLKSYRWQCAVCNLAFPTYRSRLLHAIRRHRCPPHIFKCMWCSMKFGSSRSRKSHELFCAGPITCYQCPFDQCGYISKFSTVVRSHLQIYHGIHRRAMVNKQVQCELCLAILGPEKLTAHLRGHCIVKSKFECNICTQTFPSLHQRHSHVTQVHTEKLEVCEYCGEIVPRSSLKRHLIDHNHVPLSACPYCNQKVKHGNLGHHIALKHPQIPQCICEICCETVSQFQTEQKIHTCKLCSKTFCKAVYLVHHNILMHGIRKKTVKKEYKCQICQKVFYTKKAMFKHGQLHTLNRDVPISPVRPSLQNDPDLYEPLTTESQQDDADPALHVIHIGQDTVQYLPKMGDSSLNAVIKELIVYNQSGDLPYKCVLCNRQFAKMKYIKLHIRRAHVKDENQPYRCKVCGSGFVRLTEFRKHTRSHSDFRPFKCKFCNKAFKQQANLKEHLFVHDNIKHFQCYLCSKWFRQRGALTSHVVLHDKLKPFKCTFCGKGFTTRGELGRHMKRYESEERRNEKCYSCYLCMKAFPHFPLLMKHIDQHNPEKPFTCEICTDTFSNYVALYFHKVKYQHVLETEVVQVQHTENPSRLKYKPSVLYEDGDVVYVNQTLDGHMIENDGSSGMEVVIHNIDKHGGIQFTEKHPEQDELLSIAQQLTELSNIPKKKGSANPSRKEEDEIVKTMLDADADVMASLTKTSTSDYTSASSAPPGRRPTVRDLLEDNYTYSSSHSVPEPQEPEYTVVNDFPVTGEYQMDMTTQALVSCPSNMEELASLIVQQSDTSDQDNMLAIQDEDGSIIYVCLPQGTGVDQNVEETTVPFAEMDTNSMGASVNVQNVVVLSENETNDYTEHFEETQPDPNTMENIVIEASNIQEDLETPIDAENHDQNNYVIEAEHVESTISSTFAENINPTINPTQTEAESSENISTEEIITTQTSVEEIPQEIITSTVLENPPPSRLLQVLASGDAVSSSPLATALLAGTTPGIGAEGEHSGEIIEGSQLVPIDNDDSNFTQEELLDIEYQQNLEDNDDVMVMQGKFRYTFDKNEKKFTCLHCNATLCNYKNLKGHLKRHMPRETFMFKCDQCESRFCSNNELTRHVRVHTREKNYACPMCDKMFIQKGHLDTHMRMHQGIKPYKCDQCDARFITSSQRKVHWTRKHGNSEIPCDQCDLTFKTQVDMYQHKGRYHVLGQLEKGKDKAGEKDGGVHVCEKCGKKFGNRRSLLHHLFEHSVQDKVHKCQECTQEFRSRELLREHAKQEHENHVYVCNQCGEAFLNRKFLNAHMKENHPQEYEASSSKTSVKEPCKICGKLFAKGVSMMYHLGSQHADAVLGESSNSSSSTEQS